MIEALTEPLGPIDDASADLVSYLASDTRERVGKAVEILHNGERLPFERETKLIEAIDRLDLLLKQLNLDKSERQVMQAEMRRLGDVSLALSAFGPIGIRHYFELLSGPDLDSPYFFAVPLYDDDLESYLHYEFEQDPSSKDQSVLDYLEHDEDRVETVSINMVISRMKANPDFYLKMRQDSRLNCAENNPIVKQFCRVVFGAEESCSGSSNKPDCNEEFLVPVKKASAALSYLFYNKDRTKKIQKYGNTLHKGDRRLAKKLYEEIRIMDTDRFRQISEIKEN